MSECCLFIMGMNVFNEAGKHTNGSRMRLAMTHEGDFTFGHKLLCCFKF